jgi:HEPN domain-containing protein
MTPKELRQNAREKICSAKALLDAGHYDDASYLVGYAPELVLKARYCTRRGWTDFPDDLAEANRRGAREIFIHDLDELLRLSDHTSIQSGSMLHIDWSLALNWSEQHRYQRVGTVARERAEKQTEETRKLFVELALFEIVEKLLVVEREVSQSEGPFNFFGLVERATQNQGWELVMSAWWLKVDDESKATTIIDKVKADLDEDLCSMIVKFSWFDPRHDLIQRFHTLGQMTGFFEHHPRCITSHNVVIDRIMPPAFIITNAPRQMA